MQITFFSLFMSVIWSSVLAVFNYLCRKKHFFIRQLGITNILFLYLCSVIRMIVPYEFPFTKVIPPQKVFHELCGEIPIHGQTTDKIPALSLLTTVWAAVSIILIARFVWQYKKTMKEFSTYAVRDDEQCQRIFYRVLNVSRVQLNIDIRTDSAISIPMGAGIFRKRYILLPEKEYSDSELYYILRHEYTHFQNNDLVIKILIHIYSCIFWWNPVIYLLKRDLAQILEIKCDLDVTDTMEIKNKAQYLTTIVDTLKNAGSTKKEQTFYGTSALVAKDYESKILERFRLVSASCGQKRNSILFTGTWFLIFSMVLILSYSFVIRPDQGFFVNELKTKTPACSSYTIECVDGTYYVHFCSQ